MASKTLALLSLLLLATQSAAQTQGCVWTGAYYGSTFVTCFLRPYVHFLAALAPDCNKQGCPANTREVTRAKAGACNPGNGDISATTLFLSLPFQMNQEYVQQDRESFAAPRAFN